MLTPTERALVFIMQTLEIAEDSIIGIMLKLKDNEEGQNLLIEFIRNSEPKELTEEKLVHKTWEIVK